MDPSSTLHDKLIELDPGCDDGLADRHRIAEGRANEIDGIAKRVGRCWGTADSLVNGSASKAAVDPDWMAEQLPYCFHRLRGRDEARKLLRVWIIRQASRGHCKLCQRKMRR